MFEFDMCSAIGRHTLVTANREDTFAKLLEWGATGTLAVSRLAPGQSCRVELGDGLYSIVARVA